MGIVNQFFTAHLPEIFFIYGLAFFLTGVAVMLELTRSPELPVGRTLPYLGLFGLIHGTHEWLEMFQLMAARSPGPLWHVSGSWYWWYLSSCWSSSGYVSCAWEASGNGGPGSAGYACSGPSWQVSL